MAKILNRGLAINTNGEDALKVNGVQLIDKDGKIYGDIHAAAGSIGTTELADDAVTNAKIGALAVGSTELAANAVTTAKIADLNVTAGKLAADAVETAKIKDGNVTLGKLATAISPVYVVKFFVLGSSITGSTLEGLAIGDLVLTVLAGGTSVVAPVTVVDTLPADPADTTYIIVFRATA